MGLVVVCSLALLLIWVFVAASSRSRHEGAGGARGEAAADSDWDFLVVVDREIERPLKIRLQARIGVRLVFEGLPSDVLIISAERFAEREHDVGHIAYYAAKEGVAI